MITEESSLLQGCYRRCLQIEHADKTEIYGETNITYYLLQ
jgi:hypothetical protein